MTSVTLCIPWRPQPDRLAAYDRVTAFWGHHGYGQKAVVADTAKTKPFNLARARNTAAKLASGDVIIMADADTIPDIGAVTRAIDMAAEGGVVVYPFDVYRHIPGDTTTAPDLLTIAPEREYPRSVGGLFVTSAETYWSLNGQDERFEPRWGYDDSAFHLAARTLATVRRVPGYVYSFNHSADRDMSDDNPNKHRYELYRYADGKPNVMRELIKR